MGKSGVLYVPSTSSPNYIFALVAKLVYVLIAEIKIGKKL